MTEHEYQTADRELFAMLNGGTPTATRSVGVVVSVKQAKKLEAMEKLLGEAKELLTIAGRVGVTLVFLGATVFGWMHPTFGAGVTAAAFLWAVHHFWRWRHGRK